jgi:hypothetical protein
MSEVQERLSWLRSNGFSDTVIAGKIGYSRENVTRARLGQTTGKRMLPLLRDMTVTIDGQKIYYSGYHTSQPAPTVQKTRAYTSAAPRSIDRPSQHTTAIPMTAPQSPPVNTAAPGVVMGQCIWCNRGEGMNNKIQIYPVLLKGYGAFPLYLCGDCQKKAKREGLTQ